MSRQGEPIEPIVERLRDGTGLLFSRISTDGKDADVYWSGWTAG